MSCSPLDLFGLPYSCDPMVTFLAYVIPVAVVCVLGCAFAIMMLIWMGADRRAERAEQDPEVLEAVLSEDERRVVRKAARAVQVVERGSGDRRRAAVKDAAAVASVLDEVDS